MVKRKLATETVARFSEPDRFVGGAIASSLPLPLIMVGLDGRVLYANQAAEQFFAMGLGFLLRQKLADLVPFGSPLLQLVQQTRDRGASIAERNVDLSTPRFGERLADVTLTTAPEPEGAVIVLLQERGLAQRIDRQLLYRGAARSMSGMAAVLAHEIKNPLAGIRGAAQLLEETVPMTDRPLVQLICDETDRVRVLIDRMEAFGDPMALTRTAVNIHEVLDRVKQVAETSFGRRLRIIENFDPSLPPVSGDRDSLIQAFMNIVRSNPNVRGVLWGHVHQSLDSFVHGVRFMATPATCAQFLPGSVDFAIDNRPPGYRMLELMPDGAIQTEVCWLESYAQSVVA